MGANEIDYGKEKPWFVRLLFSFVNPFSLVLLLVARCFLFHRGIVHPRAVLVHGGYHPGANLDFRARAVCAGSQIRQSRRET